jgi:hypothetical protein
MTKKEKVLVALLQQTSKFKNDPPKDLLKYIHTVNHDFENISPFAWEEKNGNKKIKNKIKKLYN